MAISVCENERMRAVMVVLFCGGVGNAYDMMQEIEPAQSNRLGYACNISTASRCCRAVSNCHAA